MCQEHFPVLLLLRCSSSFSSFLCSSLCPLICHPPLFYSLLFLPLLYIPPASWADLANTNTTGGLRTYRQSRASTSHTVNPAATPPSLQAAFLIPHASPLTHLGISSGSHLLPLLLPLLPSPPSASIHSAASRESERGHQLGTEQ